MSLRGRPCSLPEAISSLSWGLLRWEKHPPRNDMFRGFLFRVGEDCSVEAGEGQERGVGLHPARFNFATLRLSANGCLTILISQSKITDA